MGLIRRNWVWILAVMLGIGVFTAFRLNQKPESEYFTAKVEQGDIRQVIEATGTINPVTLVQVGVAGFGDDLEALRGLQLQGNAGPGHRRN